MIKLLWWFYQEWCGFNFYIFNALLRIYLPVQIGYAISRRDMHYICLLVDHLEKNNNQLNMIS